MRYFFLFASILFLLIFDGCCKEDSSNVLSHCKILNASKSPNEIIFYNYYNDTLFEINKNQGLFKLKYGKDTLQITQYELFGGFSNFVKYYKKSVNQIEVQYYIAQLDSGIENIVLNNDLIVSNSRKGMVVETYLYNSDNTIQESNIFDTKTIYEYYDIIDNIGVDKNLVLLTNYFKLKTVFKLVKKKTVIDNGVSKITDYQYQFDSNNKVTKCIVNNKDTISYSYLCN